MSPSMASSAASAPRTIAWSSAITTRMLIPAPESATKCRWSLWGSGRIKNRVEWWQVSSEDARNAAQTLIASNPAVHNPVAFSGTEQTTVEHWDRRWRVSGYVDTRPQPGVKVRTLYFAVLLHNGSIWNLEDLQLQSMESGLGAAAHKN
jgi:hypothetical protein